MNPQDFLQDCKVRVWPNRYAVVKAQAIPSHYMAMIQDDQETTVILEESQAQGDFVLKIESGWKVLTFEVVLPFELVGFLAVVAQALAEEKISIFALSAYSTDHLLVKADKLDKALDKLQSLGCQVAS